MRPDFDRYFRDYAELYNKALTDHPDYEAIMDRFTKCFIAAGPKGVECGESGAEFLATLEKGYAFYKQIGTKRMSVRHVQATEIDGTHHIARVYYHAEYVKDDKPIAIDFDVTYVLENSTGKPKIFAFISGDEMALYKKYGLVA